MRALLSFLCTLVAAGIAAAAVAYPVYELTSRVASWPFHRVYARLAMLAGVVMLVWLCRRLKVTSRRDLGYGLPWRRFLAVTSIFGALGIVTAGVGAVFLLAEGVRVVNDPALLSAPRLARLVLIALSSGIAVALIEETVMRGALHSAIARESGEWRALLWIAPLFAVLHFFAKAHVDAPDWSSGLRLLAQSFAPLGDPARVYDAFLAWMALSLVLSLTRVLSGNIAAAIGLHAGWVMVLRFLQESTGSSGLHSVWVGRLDGLLGLWILPWCGAIGLALWLTRGAFARYAGEARGASEASRSSRSTGSPISR
ncbi:MAG TPA: CPBP family glutamic-type intramembrane protease [Steroidobacteraceae bacterium]|nr:CPBP family glutamic-type intramembrane protease [Steroidobacteraceae bacterium]